MPESEPSEETIEQQLDRELGKLILENLTDRLIRAEELIEEEQYDQ